MEISFQNLTTEEIDDLDPRRQFRLSVSEVFSALSNINSKKQPEGIKSLISIIEKITSALSNLKNINAQLDALQNGIVEFSIWKDGDSEKSIVYALKSEKDNEVCFLLQNGNTVTYLQTHNQFSLFQVKKSRKKDVTREISSRAFKQFYEAALEFFKLCPLDKPSKNKMC